MSWIMSGDSSTGAFPWLRDGELLTSEFKAEIGRCAEKLERNEDEERQTEGAEELYAIMMDIWGLETGELSRRAADIACDEIRYILLAS